MTKKYVCHSCGTFPSLVGNFPTLDCVSGGKNPLVQETPSSALDDTNIYYKMNYISCVTLNLHLIFIFHTTTNKIGEWENEGNLSNIHNRAFKCKQRKKNIKWQWIEFEKDAIYYVSAEGHQSISRWDGISWVPVVSKPTSWLSPLESDVLFDLCGWMESTVIPVSIAE